MRPKTSVAAARFIRDARRGTLRLAGLAGRCEIAIVYRAPTIRRVQPPSASVALTVVDQRPAGLSGSDRRQVGTLRLGYGIPFAVYERGPERITELVTRATADALQQAGIAPEPSSARVLVASVTRFWADGFAGYTGVVEVNCSLQDHSGKSLWSALVRGAGGRSQWWGPSVVETVFSEVLGDYTTRAARAFESEEFQTALL